MTGFSIQTDAGEVTLAFTERGLRAVAFAVWLEAVYQRGGVGTRQRFAEWMVVEAMFAERRRT